MLWSLGIDGSGYCIYHYALFITHGASNDEHEQSKILGKPFAKQCLFFIGE